MKSAARELACRLPSEKRLSRRPRGFQNSGKGFLNSVAALRDDLAGSLLRFVLVVHRGKNPLLQNG
jgi:hypothetical protein